MHAIKIGLIGGTGLGDALVGSTDGEVITHTLQTPFGPTSGPIIETTWAGVPVFGLSRHGKGHRLAPAQVPFRANLFALKVLGCTHVLATGAVGSLREEYRPRDVVIPDQIIDKTFRRPGTFFESAAVHVEFAEPFCPVLRQILKDAASEASSRREGQMRVHPQGCYVAMEGPAFSTRAESLMHRLWGGDLVGMTAMPEAKLAKEAELPYALVALVTDYDSWRAPTTGSPSSAAGVGVSQETSDQEKKHELLNEIIGNLRVAGENAMTLLRVAVERIAHNPSALDACPARHALELAVWSDKTRVPQEEVERLRPLWGRYFPGR
jgi:5'-methylthioadenosine phosphorylase